MRLGAKFAAALALVIAAALCGCGYGVAGRTTRVSPNVQTIAIPAFENRTQSYLVEQMLTESVVREFGTRTRYRIVTAPSDEADATLRGVVLSSNISPVTFDSKTGRASTALVTVSVSVTFTDRQGKTIYSNPSYTFREQYQISRELSSFFEEESTALTRVSQDFARTLVSNVLEAF